MVITETFNSKVFNGHDWRNYNTFWLIIIIVNLRLRSVPETLTQERFP